MRPPVSPRRNAAPRLPGENMIGLGRLVSAMRFAIRLSDASKRSLDLAY
jgi:hypothetical protein